MEENESACVFLGGIMINARSEFGGVSFQLVEECLLGVYWTLSPFHEWS